jgi:hypothetical protein
MLIRRSTLANCAFSSARALSLNVIYLLEEACINVVKSDQGNIDFKFYSLLNQADFYQ